MGAAVAPPPPLKVGHIHDVQELGKFIPERFVRDDAERPTLIGAENPSLSGNIPVIDLAKLLKGNGVEFHSEISQLSASCEEWGFFQVINHGVELELLGRIEKLAMEFFNLPLEVKKKYPMPPGTVQGYGQAFVFSEDQKLDWCNMFALSLEPHFTRKSELWPTQPPNFSETIDEYSREIRKVCKTVLRFIALSLGLNDNAFEDMFGVAVQALRMNYYPPCSRPELVNALSPHSDGSAITVLQQRKDSPVGLQILHKDTWLPVQLVPNALVINIGDTMEVLTNGRYKSVEHRAVAHQEKDRLTFVTFYAPSYEVELGPIQELVDEKNPSKFRRYNHGQYAKNYVTNRLEGKKRLDFCKFHVHQ